MKDTFGRTADMEPGKKNKLKVGDKVSLKAGRIKWWAEHLCWLYQTYDTKEIKEKDLKTVYFIIKTYLSGKSITGTVGWYGAEDEDNNGRKNVWVNFSSEDLTLGSLEMSSYFFEKDLTKVKSK